MITTPEARSPFVPRSAPTGEIFRGGVGNGSPVGGQNYTRSGSLFVVNLSPTPGDSPVAAHGYFQKNASGFSKLREEAVVNDLGGGSSVPRNIPGYRGSSGIFPSVLTSLMGPNQGAFAPQIRPSVVETSRNVPVPPGPTPAAQQKRSIFQWSKQPRKSDIRSLKISKPVMDEDNGSFQRPFARMQTIDLAQAAVYERERREAGAERSRLVANRPAPPRPQPITLSAQEALRRSVSVKRKEMPCRQPREPLPTISRSSSSALSVDAANSTINASLSPSHEKVRRRSPRHDNSFNLSIDDKAALLPTLQEKQYTGLPSNPRETDIGSAGLAKEQTVMFMTGIVYDHPGIVKTIIKGAPNMYASAHKANFSEKPLAAPYTTDLNSSESIIHRPRPYRKNPSNDRALFPGEPSPRHGRTKSGSSIAIRKSVLGSPRGSPNRLPSLPALPTSAAKLNRLLFKDTKSMTLDEKIQLLFPAPPGASILHRRSSSVPSLPRVPSAFISSTPSTQSPTQEEQASRRASKRTTTTSFTIPDIPAQAPKQNKDDGNRVSADVCGPLADQVDGTWIPGITMQEVVDIGGLNSDLAKRDSHILQNTRRSNVTNASSSNVSTEDDSTTYRGSIHSETPAVDLSKAMRNAKPTFVHRPMVRQPNELIRLLPPPRTEESDAGGELMTVMFVGGEGSCPSILLFSADNGQSPLLHAGQMLPGDKKSSTGKQWHRRIGDEVPTFTQRKASTNSRKMPPPTPLLLGQRSRRATVVAYASESSPPIIDSPARAIAEIQAQLNRIEEPDRGSVGSIIRRNPDGGSEENDGLNEDRLRLLENLENEVGQQENQWQQMQTSLERDSMSTINTVMTPAAATQAEGEDSRELKPSQRLSRTPSRVVSQRAHIRSSMTLRSWGGESIYTTSTQSSDDSRASIWQQRLAEAQMEYMQNAPALLRKRSMNFLSVSKSHQFGSPTPPDSDYRTKINTDSEMESDSESEQAAPGAPKEPVSLWAAQLPSPKAAVGGLWNPPHQTTERASSPEPPAKSIRPSQRETLPPLSISGSNLWSKPASSVHSCPKIGLWGPKPVRPVSIRTRPVTQRPPRKPKRVTFLPDIGKFPTRNLATLLINCQSRILSLFPTSATPLGSSSSPGARPPTVQFTNPPTTLQIAPVHCSMSISMIAHANLSPSPNTPLRFSMTTMRISTKRATMILTRQPCGRLPAF